MATNVDPSGTAAPVRVDCPITHAGGAPCWLCGSLSKAPVSVWVFEQWVMAGKPRSRPAKEGA